MSDVSEYDELQKWLDANLGISGEHFAVETISGGASNLTLGVDVGDRRLVVRRPPVGH